MTDPSSILLDETLEFIDAKMEKARSNLLPLVEAVGATEKDLEVDLMIETALEMLLKKNQEAIEATSLLVQGALRDILDKPYEYKLETTEDGGLTQKVRLGDIPWNSPVDFWGGAVCRIIDVALRISVVLLSPSLAKVVILDEPLTELSSSTWDRFIDWIVEISNQTGLQFIMVTHFTKPAGNTFCVTKDIEGRSRVNIVTQEVE